MRHDHEGPWDVACEGCFLEAQQDLDEETRRTWRRILWVYLIGSIILTLVLVTCAGGPR